MNWLLEIIFRLVLKKKSKPKVRHLNPHLSFATG